jgi:hypothetical protein
MSIKQIGQSRLYEVLLTDDEVIIVRRVDRVQAYVARGRQGTETQR